MVLLGDATSLTRARFVKVGVDDPEPESLIVVVAPREERPSCDRCGTAAWAKDHREVDLVDRPAFDQQVTPRVVRTRWRCARSICGVGSWRIEHPDIAAAKHRLTTRAARRATYQVGRCGRTVSEATEVLGILPQAQQNPLFVASEPHTAEVSALRAEGAPMVSVIASWLLTPRRL